MIYDHGLHQENLLYDSSGNQPSYAGSNFLATFLPLILSLYEVVSLAQHCNNQGLEGSDVDG